MAGGDRIRVPSHRILGKEVPLYWRHGIDRGDGAVIHCAGRPRRKRNAGIERTSLDAFSGGLAFRRARPAPGRAFPPNEVVRRAESRIGERRYNLLWNNCEHFARWRPTREDRVEQVRDAIEAIVAIPAIVRGGRGTPQHPRIVRCPQRLCPFSRRSPARQRRQGGNPCAFSA